MEADARQGGRDSQEKLDSLPCCPPELEYLWEYFWSIGATRQNYGWSVSPILNSEILAWCQLRKIKLDPWELDTLGNLDGLFVNTMNKKKDASNGGS